VTLGTYASNAHLLLKHPQAYGVCVCETTGIPISPWQNGVAERWVGAVGPAFVPIVCALVTPEP
jgi:hypothetical protein